MISDYTTESILKLKQHPWYADFVKEGVVDFSVLDCESVDTVTLFSSFQIDHPRARQQETHSRHSQEPPLPRRQLRLQQSPQRRHPHRKRLSIPRSSLAAVSPGQRRRPRQHHSPPPVSSFSTCHADSPGIEESSPIRFWRPTAKTCRPRSSVTARRSA